MVIGAQFQEAVHAFQWVALYVIAAPLAALFTETILYATGRHRAYLASTVVGAGSAILFYLILPPVFGVAGACVAFVLGEVGVALCAFLLCPPQVRAATRTPYGDRLIASALMAAVLCIALPTHMPPLLLVGLGCGTYVAVCVSAGRNLLRREIGAIT